MKIEFDFSEGNSDKPKIIFDGKDITKHVSRWEASAGLFPKIVLEFTPKELVRMEGYNNKVTAIIGEAEFQLGREETRDRMMRESREATVWEEAKELEKEKERNKPSKADLEYFRPPPYADR